MKKLLIILFILIVNKVFSQTGNEQYYQDYMQACELISCKYIYLERKLDIAREDFLQERTKYANSIQWDNEQFLLVQRNGYLSIEEIPTITFTIHPSFYLYSKKIDSLNFSILHIRDFSGWNANHIDTIIGNVLEANPDFLLIDLKDCAGGSFNNLLFLSHALNLTKSYEFFYDIITNEKKRFSGVSNFDFISEKIELKNKWKGKVIVRTNEICGSACDFFIRHLKVNNRAVIVGTAPAGRGGGTDSFVLKNTQTKISFPLRERIPVDYLKSIESDVMKIDYYSEKEISGLIIDLMRERIITPHKMLLYSFLH